MNIYFSDYFQVDPKLLKKYGAFDISLINDLPVFIDPFLLFNSKKKKYQKLHREIIKYVRFLRDMSLKKGITPGLLKSWFVFPEIKQNWLGYCKTGNSGRGLGSSFAKALNRNLNTIFTDFGAEEITQSSHLEKLCLIKDDVGRDNISDFTTNLILDFLCRYTQEFATSYLDPEFLDEVLIHKASFNYTTRTWEGRTYTLPVVGGDYILLTPRDILTKDDTWINKNDLIGDFSRIADALPNAELRALVNAYFLSQLPKDAKKKDRDHAAAATIREYPDFIDYFIRYKEVHGDEAVRLSDQKVKETEEQFIKNVRLLYSILDENTKFCSAPKDTLDEAYERVLYLKQVIENNDGYKIFYLKGVPIKRELDLQILFRLVWFGTPSDVNSEVNNGRGPVDYKISQGVKDKTLVEFKLASNSQLKKNLQNQVKIYEDANQTRKSIKVIMYFSEEELEKVQSIMNDLKLKEGRDLVLIDACWDNKISASKA